MKTRSMLSDNKKRKAYLDNESPLCKEILISKPLINTENSSQTYSDADTPTIGMSPFESESSRSYQKIELASQTDELRKNFDEFQKSIMDLEPYADSFLQGLKKHLQFKVQKVCSPHELAEYFEPILFKLAKNPKQVRKNWSETETTLLVNIVIYYCLLKGEEAHSLSDQAYRDIAKIYPGKREDQLKLRWQSLLKVTLSKAPWTKEEDEILTEIVQEKGPHRWKNVALELAKRSGSVFLRQGKQCRERWINHLDPKLRKEGWDESEDLKLLNLLLELGKKWAEIAKRLGGRTENNVKNRWISLLRRYKVHLENNLPSIDLDDNTDCIEKNFARAILQAKQIESLKSPTKSFKLEPQSAKIKAEEDSSSNETSSISDNMSQRHSTSKTANSSPVKTKKVSKTSKKIVENLAKNLEKREFTGKSAKLSQLRQLGKTLPILSNSLAKLEWELEDHETPKNSLLVPSLPSKTDGKEEQKTQEDNKTFELLTQQFKLMPSLMEPPRHGSTHLDLEQDFIRYPGADDELGLKMPALSRRSSAMLFSEPSHQNNNALNMISKGIANTELYSMKEHSDDSKAIRSLNDLDSFTHSLSTDFPNSLESLDNPHSKMLIQPSIIRRRTSIEHHQPFPHHDHHYENSYLDLSQRKQQSMLEPHHGSYYFPPLMTKKDSLFMIDEPAEEHYEEPHFNVEHPGLYQVKHDEYLQNWPYKVNDSSQFNLNNLNFTRNAGEYSQSFDRKF